MKRLIVLLLGALALCFPAAPTFAQTVSAVTVSACGTPGNTPVVGNPYPLTQDTTRVLCTSSTGGGGGGSASYTAAAAPFAVSAGVNKPAGISTLNSAQWIVPVKPGTTTEVDLSLPSALIGVDGATIATLANPVPTTAGLVAGTALVGKVGIDQTTPGTTNGVTVVPATTGGASSATFEVAASDNHQVIKNGAGTLYTMDGFSIHTAAMFIRLYDAGTGFNGCNSATGLLWEGQIPGPGTTGGGFTKSWGDVGKAFATGLAVCVTGAYGNTNTTSATASVASVNLGYK